MYFLHFLPKITYEKNTKKCLDHKIVLISCSITQLFEKFVLISCVLISCRINYMSYTFHVLRYLVNIEVTKYVYELKVGNIDKNIYLNT